MVAPPVAQQVTVEIRHSGAGALDQYACFHEIGVDLHYRRHGIFESFLGKFEPAR